MCAGLPHGFSVPSFGCFHHANVLPTGNRLLFWGLETGLTPKFYCTAGNTSFTCDLTDKLLTWFKTNNPSKNNGVFLFKVDVYSNSDSKLPLLTLNSLFLELTNIIELQ
jgi:hypothetical protein